MVCMSVVNFDDLVQASDIWIERRQVVFLWWMQDSYLGSLKTPFASKHNARSQTDWAIGDQAKKNLELNSPSLWWVSIQPTVDWFSHIKIYGTVILPSSNARYASSSRFQHITDNNKKWISCLHVTFHSKTFYYNLGSDILLVTLIFKIRYTN